MIQTGLYFIKTHNTIPLFWQYNLDSGVEILTAAYFPKIFEVNNTRIDRPTYPAIANFFGKIIGLVLKPFVDLNKLEKSGYWLFGYENISIFHKHDFSQENSHNIILMKRQHFWLFILCTRVLFR
jgi:hypothetical protein